ncbi:hypothetical protein HNQ77_003095 [Silvibacterium bohemicum]|uniref:Uncharacterized protein n=1 Tax=Silvibacterium bohemicum TaxID=1577686 RepID=A0A841JXI6_9BACT|nr:hypothetical protein [Silvibacterium bohemicum]
MHKRNEGLCFYFKAMLQMDASVLYTFSKSGLDPSREVSEVQLHLRRDSLGKRREFTTEQSSDTDRAIAVLNTCLPMLHIEFQSLKGISDLAVQILGGIHQIRSIMRQGRYDQIDLRWEVVMDACLAYSNHLGDIGIAETEITSRCNQVVRRLANSICCIADHDG